MTLASNYSIEAIQGAGPINCCSIHTALAISKGMDGFGNDISGGAAFSNELDTTPTSYDTAQKLNI